LLLAAIGFLFACGNPDANKKDDEAKETKSEKKASFRDDSKGQYGGGYISETMRAKVRTEERIDDLQLSHTLKNGWQMFQTTNTREPRSTQEFLDYIVEEMGADLPPLNEGEEFHYDSKTNTLFIRAVKQPNE